MDFFTLSRRASGLFRGGTMALAVGGGLAFFMLLFSRPDFLLPLVAILIPAVVGLAVWLNGIRPGLPILPVFLAQQALIYGLPLAIDHPGLTGVKGGVITASGLGVGLFLSFCVIGWYVAQQSHVARPSKANLDVPGGGSATDRCLTLAFLLLSVVLAFHLSSSPERLDK